MRNFHQPERPRRAGDSSSADPGCAEELRTVVPRQWPLGCVSFTMTLRHDGCTKLTICSFEHSPENSGRTATWFNSLVLEYHVRDTTCSPYQNPVHEYYIDSQAICIAQFANLFTLADTLCAGDHTGVSSQKDTSVPIWYSWKTFA